MTSPLDPLIGNSYTAVFKDANHNIRHQHSKNRLRPKENTYKNKCKKHIKRKLKKYKLRHDGKEDQDVIDVSESLVYSLYIRSPNEVKDRFELEIEELRPKNYLFRMVKRKQTTLKKTKITNKDNRIKLLEENAAATISPATEDKKQTNAFKLLMDSRNKSIGTNSPGKDKPKDDDELHDISDKKSIKAKRNLMLQKMAEGKGSLKKTEMEEQHENYIKKKMEKRAEKLKSMVLQKETKPVTDKVTNIQKIRSPLDSIDTEKNGKVPDKSLNTLQLVNMFNESDNEITSKKKIISKEDEEFLKKLSPSIRKKESMLSYFKKIEKDSESNIVDGENDNAVIKVKLWSSKKKCCKEKLSLKKDNKDKCDSIDTLHINPGIITNDIIKMNKEIQLENNIENISRTRAERKKRKRNTGESTPCKDSPKANANEDMRPKRIVKRPVKYSDDAALTSSDEELHIFTPKKKKHIDNKIYSVSKAPAVIIINDESKLSEPNKKMDNKEKSSKKEMKCSKNVNTTKPIKLAPIFSKTQPDAAAIEAKQKFLQSGVPEELKKMMSKQKACSTFTNSFPIIVHVQQLDLNQSVTLLPLTLSEEMYLEDFKIKHSEAVFTNMLNMEISRSAASLQSKNNVQIQAILQNIKESYPRFPVHRIYKLLRGKKKGEYKDSNVFSNLDNSVEILNCSIDMQNDNPDQLTWSDKYKPLSGDEIIGNFTNIKELKNWLVTWTENESKSKVNNDSDSSDYYQSEPDSRDSMKSYNNLLILSGPVGCGKTSCVYAIATELSMKVIEINASSKRTGKKMLQDLQEATQSHKVNRGTSSENSQKTQEVIEPPDIKVKKRGRPKKPKENLKKVTKEKLEVSNGLSASQENTRMAMSLILIDDADVVFDQDDGFCSAITQLVQSSKRPVILVTGSLTLPHLQKFMHSSKILKMKSLLPNMLGTWLDLMCLADSGTCWPGMGEKFLNFFKGDMRRTINCLQFYVGSQEQVVTAEINSQTESQNSDLKIGEGDENSCMSWTDHERDIIHDKNDNICDMNTQPIWDNFYNEHTHLKLSKCPMKMFDVWWNVPKMLNMNSIKNVQELQSSTTSLESISNVLDSISICDYLGHKKLETDATMISHPWYSAECDSLSELENLDYYDQKDETTRKLCCDLLVGSITAAQNNMGLEIKCNLDFPRMSAKRQRDRIVTRHTDLTSYLNQQSFLDRRALALDYWASCRAICRIERSKTDTNSKRNNRFCHYLKSLSVLCKSESFDALADSLNPDGISGSS